MVRPGHAILLALVGLLLMGVVMVTSAGLTVGRGVTLDLGTMLTSRPALFALAAVGAALLATRLPIRALGRGHGLAGPAPWIVLGGLFVLALVYVPAVANPVNGSFRWVRIGPIGFQPSELVKWSLPIVVAWHAARRPGALGRFSTGVLPPLLIVGVFAAIVAREDLGTAVLIVAVCFGMLFAGGARLRHALLLAPLAIGAVVAAVLASPYRVRRIAAFLDPFLDPQDTSYQLLQSMAAVAGGGLAGRGLGNGVQKFGYLPEDTTDFIFAVIAEELGLVGVTAVMALYLVILLSGISIVGRTRDPFSRLLGLGIMLTLGFQAVMNLLVVTGLAPTKGIALPLVSSGGTGWIVTAFALGLLVAIDREQDRHAVASSPRARRSSGAFVTKTVLLAGGGSGGHISPGLAIAECLPDDWTAVFACSPRPVDAELLAPAGVRFVPLPMVPPSARHPLRSAAALARSVRRSRALLAEYDVNVVVTLGGYVAWPAARAARRAGLPFILINLDDPPGRANRRLARSATAVWSACPLPSAPDFASRTFPFPVRRAAIGPDDAAEARRALELDPELPVLLVTGASQGSASLNRMVLHLLESASHAFAGWQALHLTGRQDEAGALTDAYAAAGVPARVLPFLDAMGLAWAAADIAVSRAGANSVAEIRVNGVPALFLPYPHHADQHQRRNAAPLVAAGAALVAEDHLDPVANAADGGRKLLALLADGDRRRAMRAAMPAAGDGAAELARAIVESVR